MLQDIRDKLLGKFAIGLIGLIAVSFVFWGASSPFIGAPYAAKVDGIEISFTQLEQDYRRQLDQYTEQFGELPESFRLPLRERVLDSLVRNTVVDVHVAQEGFRISAEQIDKTIRRTPDFQVEGIFSLDLYQSLLANAGLTSPQFKARQQGSLRKDQLQRAIAATAFVTPAEYRRYLNLMGEQRLMTVATFDPRAISEGIEVTEDEIVAFYDDRPGEFTTPEAADVEYIEIRRDILSQQVDVSEQALQDYYEDSESRYLRDEQRRARHILIPFDDDEEAAEQQAKALTARVRAGEPFEDLAQTYSKDGGTSGQGGDLGLVMQSQMPGQLGNAIFSMFEGDIEGPVRTDFGFHIVQLDEILERGPMPLAEVRAELENELRDSQVDGLYRDVERKISDALFDATELASIAELAGLEVLTVERFTRIGGEPFGANQAAIDAIFDERVSRDGGISEIIELDANRSAVFKVSNHYEATRQPIEEVRELIVGALKVTKGREIVGGKTDQLLAALADGAEFEAAANEVGGEVMQPTLVGRQSDSPDQAILVEVFNARKPTTEQPVTGTAITRTGEYAVYSLMAVIPGRPESIPLAERDAGKTLLTQQSGVQDYTAYVSQLEAEADVSISDSALEEPEFF
jgi:peptidyl-prolyl cis-trans isomerase D